jgi:hypothetical protein
MDGITVSGLVQSRVSVMKQSLFVRGITVTAALIALGLLTALTAAPAAGQGAAVGGSGGTYILNDEFDGDGTDTIGLRRALAAATLPKSWWPEPAKGVKCCDFPNRAEAQAWYEYYYPTLGDVAGLDGNTPEDEKAGRAR